VAQVYLDQLSACEMRQSAQTTAPLSGVRANSQPCSVAALGDDFGDLQKKKSHLSLMLGNPQAHPAGRLGTDVAQGIGQPRAGGRSPLLEQARLAGRGRPDGTIPPPCEVASDGGGDPAHPSFARREMRGRSRSGA